MEGEAKNRREGWEAAQVREEGRRKDMAELTKVIEAAGRGKRTPKSLLKLVIHSGGIKADEAAEILDVKRRIIDGWTGLLANKKLVVIDSKKHPNPTIKPSRQVLDKVVRQQARSKQVKKEQRIREGLEDELADKERLLLRLEEDLKKEKRYRAMLEKKLHDSDEKLRAGVEEAVDATADKMLGEEIGEGGRLDVGGTYLLLADKLDKGLKLFSADMVDGRSGLFITRHHPREFAGKKEIAGSTLYWLTRVQISEDVPSISGLQEISILVSKFIDDHKKSVVMLDGLEYLISNNDFPIVLRLIQQLRDKVSTSDSKMILPLNPHALEERELTLLELECRMIR